MKEKQKILFVSNNDGSDMRIVKEIRSLQVYFDIIFVGIGVESEKSFAREHCQYFRLVKGNGRNIFSYLKQLLLVLKVLFNYKISSIHLINEYLVLVYYPIIIFKHTVLDIFDSVFLRANYTGDSLFLVKYFFYSHVNKIIVTDSNRLNLMPAHFRSRCIVLPNYPNYIESVPEKLESKNLRIMYYGWLGLGRGTEIVEKLLELPFEIKVYMAGWFCDERTQAMIEKYKEKIEYLGVLEQEQAIKRASENADFILCVYKPVNQNNINASPNKIYDALLINTPVIMNKEVQLSSWVQEIGIGLIVDGYDNTDIGQLYNNLLKYKQNFEYGASGISSYTWGKVENQLWLAHKRTK
jgi:hypothetical protein